MKIVIIFYFSIVSSFIYSQQVEDSVPVTGFDGSFQIEIHNVRYQPNIPGNILEIVSEHRHESQTVFYPLDQNIRIKIISRNDLLSPGFQRLDLIKYY